MRKLFLLPLLILSFTAHAAARTWSQLAIGGGYQAVILISNKTGSDWTGQVFPKQGFEKPWAGTWRVNDQNYTGQTFFNVGLSACILMQQPSSYSLEMIRFPFRRVISSCGALETRRPPTCLSLTSTSFSETANWSCPPEQRKGACIPPIRFP
jgi:hypothetical protein